MLLAESGALTASHQDSHDYATFLTVNEGQIGFSWLDRPTKAELEDWAQDPYGFQGGPWCFVMMRPGETVYFPSGTVHFVFRLRGDGQQTMAIGGHLLRFSDIVQWVETIKLQLRYPNATNEDLSSRVVSGYLHAVKRLVQSATTEMIESFGGEGDIAVFEQTTKVFSGLYYLLSARPLTCLGMF